MEFKGTKGKWEVFKPKHIGLTNVSFGENNGFNPFIELWNHQFDNKKEEAEANALLISKAPEMLKALLITIEELEDIDTLQNHRDYLCKLIKEATEL